MYFNKFILKFVMIGYFEISGMHTKELNQPFMKLYFQIKKICSAN